MTFISLQKTSGEGFGSQPQNQQPSVVSSLGWSQQLWFEII